MNVKVNALKGGQALFDINVKLVIFIYQKNIANPPEKTLKKASLKG